jgi:hypothetical protein
VIPRLAVLLLTLALAAPAMGQGSGLALARWTLESVPPDAVLFAQNDADTGALLALQANGLRPDVRIVRADDAAAASLAAAWETSLRAVVGALTLDPEVFGRAAPAVVSAGAYQRPGRADEPPFDLAAAEGSANSVHGVDFAGPPEGIVNLGGVVLFGLLQTAVSHAQAGDVASAERAYARSQTFADEAHLADDPLVGIAREWIDDALAAHRALARSASDRTVGPSTPPAP